MDAITTRKSIDFIKEFGENSSNSEIENFSFEYIIDKERKVRRRFIEYIIGINEKGYPTYPDETWVNDIITNLKDQSTSVEEVKQDDCEDSAEF
jgi:hypothetical protein